MKKILIIGAGGQIGSELTGHLRGIYGTQNVLAADLHGEQQPGFVQLDALDAQAVARVVKSQGIDTIYNLVAVLSATGEKAPQRAWQINMGALVNALEVAREYRCAIFTPSSIGAFGADAPKNPTPQDTPMHPDTIYGVCKVAGELLGDYYFKRFGVDARSVRLPGVISSKALPGGGTTDYAVEIFYAALRGERFVCPIPADRLMDMIYMPDVLAAFTGLMEADPAKLRHRNAFNVASMSFSPQMIYAEIRKHLPAFEMVYEIDPVKDKISAAWPDRMDDGCARAEWGWSPKWGMAQMTADMLGELGGRLNGQPDGRLDGQRGGTK